MQTLQVSRSDRLLRATGRGLYAFFAVMTALVPMQATYTLDIGVNKRPDELKKGDEVNMTFTWKRDNKPMTLQYIYENYDKEPEIRNLFVTFVKEIKARTTEYSLWDGFKLDNYTNKRSNALLEFKLRGKYRPSKRHPKDRTDVFMQYKGDKHQRYTEIRKRRPRKKAFYEAFDVYLKQLDKKTATGKSVSFTSLKGNETVVIPKRKETQLMFWSETCSDEEVVSFFRLLYKEWHREKQHITRIGCNVGNTIASQTVPHVHFWLLHHGHYKKKMQLSGWEDQGKVHFADGFESVQKQQKAFPPEQTNEIYQEEPFSGEMNAQSEQARWLLEDNKNHNNHASKGRGGVFLAIALCCIVLGGAMLWWKYHSYFAGKIRPHNAQQTKN